MSAMRSLAVAVSATVFFSACSVSSLTRYPLSPENNQALKRYPGTRVRMASVVADFDYDVRCRHIGTIEGPEGATIPQFIARSFNDEFKSAGIYADSGGAVLVAEMTHLDFSSTAKAGSKGYWDMGMKLKTKQGDQVLQVQTRYEFASGIYNQEMACTNAAQALLPTVQDLILRAVSDPEFAQLIR